MQLALIRHAIAEDAKHGDDFGRPLSSKGRTRFKQVVNGLQALELEFEVVLHSPKLRALETAELLSGLTERLEVTKLLSEPPSPELLESLAGSSVAVVGHQPHLATLTSWLVTGKLGFAQAFTFKKGGVALLEGTPTPGGMTLTSLLTPSLLRRLRG